MNKVVTHNGGFHSDDVFAVATLELYLGKENMVVTRTRDETLINEADWVVDVGGVYDKESKRFDHHQNGAPIRENGIPYAAFGLVWEAIGEEVAGGSEAADVIEERLVLPIDAGDNGVNLYKLNGEVAPFDMQSVINLYSPTWGSEVDVDEQFLEAVDAARKILTQIIVHAKASLAERTYVKECYEKVDDKRVVICEKKVNKSHLIDFPETLFLVSPSDESSSPNWRATAIPLNRGTFESRLSFPESWRGLREEELVSACGIKGALFTHRSGFLFVAENKGEVLEAIKKILS